MSQEFHPKAWEGLKQTMPEGLADDDLRIEEEIRFGRLVMLIESGKWVRDPRGNVVPATMSPEDKRSVWLYAENSIIDSLPVFVGKNVKPRLCYWSAVGSLLCGPIEVRLPDNEEVIDLAIGYSVIIESPIIATLDTEPDVD